MKKYPTICITVKDSINYIITTHSRNAEWGEKIDVTDNLKEVNVSMRNIFSLFSLDTHVIRLM